jgi:elongation factor P hydroxylase
MLEYFYSKDYTMEMLSPSVYYPPRSINRLFMSSVAFTFTASTDSNLVPFNADLIFGNKKVHGELGQVSTMDVPTR